VDLLKVYFEALERCAPERLLRGRTDPSWPRNVVAIGKCAGAMLDGLASAHPIDEAFVAVPAGYPLPVTRAALRVGGHPSMTPASFEAGRALLAFVDAHDDILFLVSGGGSACVEVPRDGLTAEEVAAENARLVRSSLPIAAINARRRELSAIKGGRLADRVRGRCLTLVYSDVSTGAAEVVASGPTIAPGRPWLVIADNGTLCAAAAGTCGGDAVRIERQVESGVEEAAAFLAGLARRLRPGQVLVAGGEPTVEVHGGGRGGRCSELAIRFLLELDGATEGLSALFASSDGLDGNSGAAGILLQPARSLPPAASVRAALAESDSMRIASQVGEPIMIAPTGNNLRDLFLVARD
jgi:glycerate 2-kinase